MVYCRFYWKRTTFNSLIRAKYFWMGFICVQMQGEKTWPHFTELMYLSETVIDSLFVFDLLPLLPLNVSSLSQVAVKAPHPLHHGRSLSPAPLHPSSIHQGWRARPVVSPIPTLAWTVPLRHLQSPLTSHLVPPPTAATSGVTPSPNHHAQKTQIAFWMHWASSWDREWPSLMTSWLRRMTTRR